VRRLLVFVCAPGVVLGLATLVAASALGAFSHAPRPVAISCRLPVTVDLAAFEVSVLNGSGIQGQAKDVGRQLTSAGFHVASVATAPEERWTDAPAVISYGDESRDAARLLAARVPGAVLLSTPRVGRRVEVVVGTHFTGIARTPAPAPQNSCAAG
jgi:hypothetical protein